MSFSSFELLASYLQGLNLNLAQSWQVSEVLLQSLDALLLLMVLFALPLVFLFQAADVAIPCLDLGVET